MTNNGTRTQVSQEIKLRRSHSLIWSKGGAEIRDDVQNGRVVFRGTRRECVAEARRLGLWHSAKS